MALEISDLEAFFYRTNAAHTYRKGDIICSQGGLFDHVYMIKTGMVKIYDLDAAGTERTLTIFSRHNIFPIIWLLQNPPPTHLYYYQAFTDVSCYLAPQASVRAYTTQHPEVLLTAADMLTKAYLNASARVENLEKSHIHERMEFILYMLATRLGAIHDDIACIDASITQQDIASLAGVSRETMSIEINRARNRGIFWKQGHRTYINMALLDLEAMPVTFAS